MNVPFTARGLVWAEMPHVWHAFAGLPEADEAVARIGRWLREDRATGDARRYRSAGNPADLE